MMQQIDGVLYPVDGPARKIEVWNRFNGVGGMYEAIGASQIEFLIFHLYGYTALIACNEEGTLNGAKANPHTMIGHRLIYQEVRLADGLHILGNFLVVLNSTDKDGDIKGLDDNAIKQLIEADAVLLREDAWIERHK